MEIEVFSGPPLAPCCMFLRGGPRGGPKKFFGALRAPSNLGPPLERSFRPPLYKKPRYITVLYCIELYRVRYKGLLRQIGCWFRKKERDGLGQSPERSLVLECRTSENR